MCSTKGIEFFGYQFTGYSGHYDVSPMTIEKFKERWREITRRNRGEMMSVERALTNDYLAESGSVSLYELWRKTRS